MTKLTVQSIQQKSDTYWELPKRRQSAFKANLTWLYKKTEDEADRLVLREVAKTIGHTLPTVTAAPKTTHIPNLRVKLLREKGIEVQSSKITSPNVAADIATALIGDEDREHFIALLLNVRNEVIGTHTICIGSVASAHFSIREVFKVAFLANASGMILAHNRFYSFAEHKQI